MFTFFSKKLCIKGWSKVRLGKQIWDLSFFRLFVVVCIFVLFEYFQSYNSVHDRTSRERVVKFWVDTLIGNNLNRVFRYNIFNSPLIFVKMGSVQCSMHLIILLLLSIKSSKCKPGGVFLHWAIKVWNKKWKVCRQFLLLMEGFMVSQFCRFFTHLFYFIPAISKR